MAGGTRIGKRRRGIRRDVRLARLLMSKVLMHRGLCRPCTSQVVMAEPARHHANRSHPLQGQRGKQQARQQEAQERRHREVL